MRGGQDAKAAGRVEAIARGGEAAETPRAKEIETRAEPAEAKTDKSMFQSLIEKRGDEWAAKQPSFGTTGSDWPGGGQRHSRRLHGGDDGHSRRPG